MEDDGKEEGKEPTLFIHTGQGREEMVSEQNEPFLCPEQTDKRTNDELS